MINATRAAKWSAAGTKCFIAGEDLTCQAGLAVQQDLALGALIGVTHAERNGHHYVDGFGETPAAEAQAFLAAHPDLYANSGGKVRLAIHDGDLLTGSLTTPGFATSVHLCGPRCRRWRSPQQKYFGASSMTTKRLGLIMNGVTGRMGLNQHLIRSIIAIRDSGGVLLANGDRMLPDPILIGRDADKVERLAKRFNVTRWSTDLDKALADKNDTIFFDAATTQARPTLLTKAIEAGKHVYCEKPIATNLDEAVAVLRLANSKGVKHGTVQDKLFLPGLKKIAFLRDSGFFGRMLSVRGEFGYWVFEGGWQEAQRPSWNYRSEDGGGIILDMVCHWRYVLDNLFGEVESVSCTGTTDIPERFDEKNKKYAATADDSAYATFRLKGGVIAHINMSWVTRVYRDDLVTFQVDGTHGSAVAGLTDCVIQARQATPRPVWNPDEKRTHDFFADWQKRCRRTSSTTTASRSSGKCSFAMSARTRLINIRCWKAPRACSLPNAPAELARAALDRRCPDQGVREDKSMNKPVMPISSLSLKLPTADRSIETYRLAASRTFPAKLQGTLNRVAFSAAHVVADPLAESDPWLSSAIDWDRTIAFREHVWDLGLGVAESMDTAQRGMGLDWPTSLELIQRSVRAANARGGALVFSGAGTDHLAVEDAKSIDDVIRAYEEQIAAVEKAGRPDHPDGFARAGQTRPRR